MQRNELKNIILTSFVALFTAAVATVTFGRLPNLPIAELYLRVQAILFLILLGTAPIVIYRSQTAYSRIVGVFLVIAGIGVLIAIGLLYGSASQLAKQIGVAAVVFLVMSMGFLWTPGGRGSRPLLFHIVGLLVTIIYIFVIIYLATAILASHDLYLLVEVVLVTGITAFVLKACSDELRYSHA